MSAWNAVPAAANAPWKSGAGAKRGIFLSRSSPISLV